MYQSHFCYLFIFVILLFLPPANAQDNSEHAMSIKVIFFHSYEDSHFNLTQVFGKHAEYNAFWELYQLPEDTCEVFLKLWVIRMSSPLDNGVFAYSAVMLPEFLGSFDNWLTHSFGWSVGDVPFGWKDPDVDYQHHFKELILSLHSMAVLNVFIQMHFSSTDELPVLTELYFTAQIKSTLDNISRHVTELNKSSSPLLPGPFFKLENRLADQPLTHDILLNPINLGDLDTIIAYLCNSESSPISDLHAFDKLKVITEMLAQ